MDIVFKYIKGDRAIWMVVLFLTLISIPAVFSAVDALAYKYRGGNSLSYLMKHVFFLFSGLGIMYLVHKIKFTYFSRVSQVALYVSIPLLLLTLLVGENLNDASRWLKIPVINQSFQTSDLAKIGLIMYVARVLSINKESIKDFKSAFLPAAIPVAVVCGLILPANFSTSAVLFASSLVLMFIGRVSIKHIGAFVGTGVIAMVFVLLIASVFPDLFPRATTWKKRVETYASGDDETKSSSSNYQVEQSKIAIATGGVTGKGPGNSTQRNFLPHPYSDFVFSIIVEEYGLIGGFVVLMLYLILFYRCIQVVIKCPKTFGALLVVGISFILVFQALINMAVAVNLLPVTGQPLPMVSMGGTSIWFTSVALGVILSVSRGLEEENKKNSLADA